MIQSPMIKISEDTAVNPKHVFAVMFDKNTLRTKVVFGNMTNVLSDKTFEETVKLLTIKETE